MTQENEEIFASGGGPVLMERRNSEEHIQIFINDITLRDGEQSPGASLNSAEKMRIAELLVAARVDILEAGNPISAGDFHSVHAIADRFGGIDDGPMIMALARCMKVDVEAVINALMPAGRDKGVPHVYLGISPQHLKGQLRKSHAQALEMIVESVTDAKSDFNNVQFSPMDSVRADIEYLYEVIQAAIEAGATIINIPDTVGYTVPFEFAKLIWNITQNVSNIDLARISVHCHDDLNMAVANSLMAIIYGATQIECTINHMGERAGNASLEAIVMAIKTRRDFFQAYTRFVTKKLVELSDTVSELTGFLVAPNTAVVGSNAFAHSSGVHQDGFLKERDTYEIMKPEDVGRKSSKILLTARSGKAALKHHLERLHYKVTSEQLGEIRKWFVMIAPHMREVSDSTLKDMVEMVMDAPDNLSIFSVSAGPCQDVDSPFPYTASLEVLYNGEAVTWNGFGAGPVDAITNAIDLATGTSFKLLSCDTDSIGAGSETIARAEVFVSYDGSYGHGVYFDTDTLLATAMAYAHALLKIGKTGLVVQAKVKVEFSPQRVGKYGILRAATRYEIPERPENGFLVVAVGQSGKIAFFNTPVWQGGYRKSKKWTYYSIPTEGVTVQFPRYYQKKAHRPHQYGLPQFYDADGNKLP